MLAIVGSGRQAIGEIRISNLVPGATESAISDLSTVIDLPVYRSPCISGCSSACNSGPSDNCSELEGTRLEVIVAGKTPRGELWRDLCDGEPGKYEWR